MHIVIPPKNFFSFQNGDMPQPLHQKDAYGWFITLLKSSFILITSQVPTLVDMKINQRKKNKAKAKAPSQSDPMIKPHPHRLKKSRATVSS
jgi:hypothetical protein